MKRIVNITFSPTGGTQRVADRLASALGSELISIDLCDRLFSEMLPELTANDLCVLAVPSFAGRVPPLASDRIKALKGHGAMAVAVAVYGNRAYEDTLIEMKGLLTGQSFRCIAAVAAIAEHSMLRQYASGRPDADDCAQLDQFAQSISKTIEDGSISSDLPVPGNIPYREIGAFLKPEVTDGCIRCGVCADLCPAGAIEEISPDTTNLDQCISCARCISVCPVQARQLNPAMLEAVDGRIGKLLSGRKEYELFL